jgi:hypothetical protein
LGPAPAIHQYTDTKSKNQERSASPPGVTDGSLVAVGWVVYRHAILGSRDHVLNELMGLPE